MSTTTITMPSPVANGRTEKSSKKQSKIIVLPLPPSILKRFGPKKETPSIVSSPAPTVEEMPQSKPVASQEQPSEANSTSIPMQDASTPGAANKKKVSSANGVKRSTPMLSDGMPKPRGKPGPKKKPRLYVIAKSPMIIANHSIVKTEPSITAQSHLPPPQQHINSDLKPILVSSTLILEHSTEQVPLVGVGNAKASN